MKLPDRLKYKKFTKKQSKEWESFKEQRTIHLSKEQINYICELYAEIFFRQIWYPGTNESIKPLILMIDRLDIVYESY